MRLAFMGTPDFSVPILEALVAAGHHVACVYAQPPRPAGRGHKERPSPVHDKAASLGIPVRTPRTLKDPAEHEVFRALCLDVAVVAAYGLILPQVILDAPRLGCVNVHASLLPRWRGAAPIQRAILAGDAATGVTIMQMEAGLDTGPMLLAERLSLTPETTGQSLHDALSAMGARLIVDALERLEQGLIVPVPQPGEGVTYAAKLEKDEGRLDWRKGADELDRTIRAFFPWPGTWFKHRGERIKILAAAPAAKSGEPGTVLDDQLTVACGEGALRLLKVQRAGRAPMSAEELLRGYTLPAGTALDLP